MDKYAKLKYTGTRITDDVISAKLQQVNRSLMALYTAEWENAHKKKDGGSSLTNIKSAMRKQIMQSFEKDYLRWIIRQAAEACIYNRDEELEHLEYAYHHFHESVNAALDGLERLYTGHRCADDINPLTIEFKKVVVAEVDKRACEALNCTFTDYAKMLEEEGAEAGEVKQGKTEYTPTLQTADAEAAWRQSTLDEFRKMVAIRNWNNRLRKGTVKGDYIAYDGTVTEYVGSRLHDPWTHEYSTEICRQYGRWINTEDARRILGGVKVRQDKFDGFCHEVHEIMKDNDTSIKSAEGKEDAA